MGAVSTYGSRSAKVNYKLSGTVTRWKQDGSKLGVGAAVYAVVRQESGTTQRLVAAKARLAKGGLSIPRLELVAGHMATNLLTNVRNALEGLPVSNVYGWLDSTVALHWTRGSGEFKQLSRRPGCRRSERSQI